MERDVTLNVRLKLIEDSALRSGGSGSGSGSAGPGGSAGIQRAMAGVTQELGKQKPAAAAVNQEFARSVSLGREKLAISLKLLDIELAEEKRLRAQVDQEKAILDLKTKQARASGGTSGRSSGGGSGGGSGSGSSISAIGMIGDIGKIIAGAIAAPEVGKLILQNVMGATKPFADEVLSGKGNPIHDPSTSSGTGARFINWLSGIPGQMYGAAEELALETGAPRRGTEHFGRAMRGLRLRDIPGAQSFLDFAMPFGNSEFGNWRPFSNNARDRPFYKDIYGPDRHGPDDPNGPQLLRLKTQESAQSEVVSLYRQQADATRALIDAQFKLRDVSLDIVRSRDRSIHGATALELDTANKIASFVSANGGGMQGLSKLTREQMEIANSTPGVREQIQLMRDMDYRQNGLRGDALATQRNLSAAFGTSGAERAAITAAAVNVGVKQEIAVNMTIRDLDKLPKELEDKMVDALNKQKQAIIETVKIMMTRATIRAGEANAPFAVGDTLGAAVSGASVGAAAGFR